MKKVGTRVARPAVVDVRYGVARTGRNASWRERPPAGNGKGRRWVPGAIARHRGQVAEETDRIDWDSGEWAEVEDLARQERAHVRAAPRPISRIEDSCRDKGGSRSVHSVDANGVQPLPGSLKGADRGPGLGSRYPDRAVVLSDYFEHAGTGSEVWSSSPTGAEGNLREPAVPARDHVDSGGRLPEHPIANTRRADHSRRGERATGVAGHSGGGVCGAGVADHPDRVEARTGGADHSVRGRAGTGRSSDTVGAHTATGLARNGVTGIRGCEQAAPSAGPLEDGGVSVGGARDEEGDRGIRGRTRVDMEERIRRRRRCGMEVGRGAGVVELAERHRSTVCRGDRDRLQGDTTGGTGHRCSREPQQIAPAGAPPPPPPPPPP